MNELDQQRVIKDSFKRAGGMAHKFPSGDVAGWPDLMIRIREFGAVDMEVKFLKGVKAGFSRKVGATPLQRHTMRRINENGGLAMIGMVTYYDKMNQYLTLLHPDTEQFTEDDLQRNITTVRRVFGEGYDVVASLRKYRIQYDGR